MEILKEEIEAARGLRVRSSFADDVWHGNTIAPDGYEWWYFDAISDDGRDVLVIIFLANFVFSPRYNRGAAQVGNASARSGETQFPAVAVWLYRDGRSVLRSIREYRAEEFSANSEVAGCRIGQNEFHLQQARNEASYALRLNLPLRRAARLEAALQWKVIDGDLWRDDSLDSSDEDENSAHDWNVVAPRCRVSGSFVISSQKRAKNREIEFRGTGYHDHNRDARWMPATIAEWQWGRAHFDDVTAVFYRYREREDEDFSTRLFIVRDSALSNYKAIRHAREWRTHLFGLRYPREMIFETFSKDARRVFSVRQRQTIEGSFFYLRFTGEATLELGDEPVRRAPAITEHFAPHSLLWRSLHWLIDMRIGRGERSSFLP